MGNKSKKRIINRAEDEKLKKIKAIIESQDPSLDEPIICELYKKKFYKSEYCIPPPGETYYRTMGEEIKRGGSIPLTLREYKIIEIIGITAGIQHSFNRDKDYGTLNEELLYRDVLVEYENNMEAFYGKSEKTSIDQKTETRYNDMDKKRLHEKRKRISKIKNGQDQQGAKKGLLQIKDLNRSNSSEDVFYEIEITDQQAALIEEIYNRTENNFKTYEEIEEEKKFPITLAKLKEFINKIRGREGAEK